ncbi:response regulator [Patescibacteria group bacterium]|nr:response regulator [Patescibacteria group bacterium]MBU1889913.1 response regulator [Patescibacteria group bacterium]
MPEKILLVEDEQTLVKMYEEIFRRYTDFNLFKAYTKEEGLQLATLHIPSIILLDLIIPEKTGEMVAYDRRVGFDLLKELRAHPETRDISVLVFSNMDTHEDRATSEELGVAEYLLKADYTPQRLIEKIKKHLNN